MDKTQTAPFRQQLLTQQSELLAQLAAQRGGGVIGRAEVAAEHFGNRKTHAPRWPPSANWNLPWANARNRAPGAVEAALARIEAGTYGECTDCGAHITAARLHAQPEAARCVHCQEKAEQHPRAA